MGPVREIRAPKAATVALGALLVMLAVVVLSVGGGSTAAAATAGRPVSHRVRVSHKPRPRHKRHRRRHHRVAVKLLPAVASWYYDEGSTACGFHAEYGVANKTLPCGAKVTLSYGGHTVVATVDDRGPFVYGRTFDLDQRTAGALGMWGVATVLCSQL
jgi:hypothetical protein